MTTIFYYLKLELRNILKSKGLIAILLIAPITYAFLYPQPYANEVIRNVPIGIVDQDNSLQSRALIKMLNATETLEIVAQYTALESAKKALNHQNIFGILVIPPYFEHDITASTPVSLPFYGDASYILIYNNIATTVNSVIANVSSDLSVNKQIAKGIDSAIAKGNTLSFTPTMIPLFNPQSGYATYILPPALLLILHQLLFLGVIIYTRIYQKEESHALSKRQEQTKSTFTNQVFCLLIGKWIAYSVLYFLFYWIYFAFLHFIYDIPNLATFTDLSLFSFIFFSATIFFAIACSTFIKTIDAVFILYVPLSMILFFMTGVSWPNQIIFKPLLWLMDLVPAVSGLPTEIKLSQMGASLSMVQPSLFLLIFLACFYFIIAFWRLSKLRK